MSIIYVITNKVNCKQYVGKTSFSIEKRFQEHIYDSKKGQEYTKNRPLYNAFNKYGIENFTIEMLEEVEDNHVDDRERYWIAKLNTYNNGYNATLGGDGQTQIDRAKVLELYHEGYNNTQIANILGHERAAISRIVKSFGLQSQYEPPAKAIQLVKSKEKLSFSSRRDAAKYLIDNNITRSKNIDIVAGCLYEAIKRNRPYFGYNCYEI